MNSGIFAGCMMILVAGVLLLTERAMKRGHRHVVGLAAVVTAIGALITAFSALAPAG